jgi:hypothetical protein
VVDNHNSWHEHILNLFHSSLFTAISFHFSEINSSQICWYSNSEVCGIFFGFGFFCIKLLLCFFWNIINFVLFAVAFFDRFSRSIQTHNKRRNSNFINKSYEFVGTCVGEAVENEFLAVFGG